MKLATDRSGRLTISSNASVLAAILALCGVGATGFLVHHLATGPIETDAVAGGGISAAMFLAAAAMFHERSQFVFDPGTRTVGWQRRRLLSESSGRLSFDQIRDVVLQRSSGEKHATLRIALLTSTGDLPLTTAYGGDSGHIERVAQTIRQQLGRKTDLVEDSIRAAVNSGRTLDAIAIARTMRGLDLTEAKRLVDEIAAGSRDTPVTAMD